MTSAIAMGGSMHNNKYMYDICVCISRIQIADYGCILSAGSAITNFWFRINKKKVGIAIIKRIVSIRIIGNQIGRKRKILFKTVGVEGQIDIFMVASGREKGDVF